MTKLEALQAMLDGKKVRRVCWNREDSLWLADGIIRDSHHDRQDMNKYAYTDWELYEEPPVCEYLWVYANGGVRWNTHKFYKTQPSNHGSVKYLERCEWSKREVK